MISRLKAAFTVTLPSFDCRYNNRVALGIGDIGRAEAALLGAAGKRLTYREPTYS